MDKLCGPSKLQKGTIKGAFGGLNSELIGEPQKAEGESDAGGESEERRMSTRKVLVWVSDIAINLISGSVECRRLWWIARAEGVGFCATTPLG